jgi:hypothetical protein
VAYKPGTILTRKDPQESEVTYLDDKKELQTKLVPDPYNDVRVIGQSPVSTTAGQQSEWEGAAGSKIVVAPLEFGRNLELHAGELDREYAIVSIPSVKPHAQPEPPSNELFSEMESPEDQFGTAWQAKRRNPLNQSV